MPEKTPTNIITIVFFVLKTFWQTFFFFFFGQVLCSWGKFINVSWWIKKGREDENDRCSKSEEGRWWVEMMCVCVWGGLEPDNSQWWRVSAGGCGSCVSETDTDKDKSSTCYSVPYLHTFTPSFSYTVSQHFSCCWTLKTSLKVTPFQA